MKRCGGLAVVQDPEDAAFDEMPRNALAAVAADHVAPVAELGALLGRLAAAPADDPPSVPRDLLIEAHLTEHGMDDIDKVDEIGERSPLTCPDCSGVLWSLHDGEQPRYRCHVGHAYTEAILMSELAEAMDAALVVALRTMEERIRLLRRMAEQDERRIGTSADYAERAAELERYAGHIRTLLLEVAPHARRQARPLAP